MLARKNCLRGLLAGLVLLILYVRRHVTTGAALAAMPLIFRYGDESMRLSEDRDGFDITFEKYSKVATVNASLPVPPIIHNIFIGDLAKYRPAWDEARATCRDHHPGYEFEFWDEDRAAEFVQREFPNVWPTWRGYRYAIQRADSLRYLILYHYGGIFMDMDLYCRRSLEPLRQFDFVAPAAYPAGVSNGFIMSRSELPFLGEVIQRLIDYDLNWFNLPYLTVSFTTGCHFLSTIHATTSLPRANLRVLWGPRRLHHLNGNVITPLFRHLGSSSWHSWDAGLLKALKKSRLGFLPCVVIALSFCFAVYSGGRAAWRRHQLRQRRRGGEEERGERGRGRSPRVKVKEEV